MALTILKIKSLKPEVKDRKYSDGEGLYLFVKSNGAKYWRLAYRFNKKQKTLALGVFPEVSLQEARERTADAKKLLNNKIDPAISKKSDKFLDQLENANSFQTIAEEWFEKQSKKWVIAHTNDVRRRLSKNIYPHIGNYPISQISPNQVLNAVKIIEKRQAFDLAHRVLGVCGQVFRYAVASGKCNSDPTRDLKGALTPHILKHQNAIPPEELPTLMNDIKRYVDIGDLQTQLALEFLAHTFVRTGELIGSKWSEFNIDKSIWKIPANRMKMKKEHLVPLSPQVINLLSRLKEFSTDSEFVFAGRNRLKHISNNTLLTALYKLGYKYRMSGHGFRAVASTILNENGFRADIIEKQLAHLDSDSVRASYNRAEYMPERKEMMIWWSNFLMNLNNSSQLNTQEHMRLAA